VSKIRLSSGHPQVSKENAGPKANKQPDFTEAWSTVGGNSFNTMFPNRHKAYWKCDTYGQLLNTARISTGVMVVQATHVQLLKKRGFPP
jgi:hypothetical protein